MRDTSEIAKQRRSISLAKNAPFWAGVNFFVLIFLLVELQCSIIPRLFDQHFFSKVIICFEFMFLLLFMLNTSYNLYLCIWIKSFMQPIELSTREYEIFGIDKNELGFVLEKAKSQQDVCDTANASFRKFMPKFEMNNSSSFMLNSIDSTAISSRLFDSSFNSTNASWSFHNVSYKDGSLKACNSLNNSKNDSGLRFRKNNSFALNSSKNAIKSDEELKNFLQTYDERTEQVSELLQSQKRFSLSIVDENNFNFSNGNASKSNPTNIADVSINTSNVSLSAQNVHDHSQDSLNNSFETYQPAIKIHSGTNQNIDKSVSVILNHHNTKDLEKILKILEVNETSLSHMVENIRRWISQTILTRLSEQIDEVNKQIMSKGYIEGIVGETPIQQLKSFAECKEKEFPNLLQIYSFFHLPSKIENSVVLQQYLVRRIKDIAKGGCINDYVWNGGGIYNYKPWKDDLPTDSELLLHLFSVYMDSRILFNPALPKGKPFTSQFIKLLNSPNSPKSDTYIEQTSVTPPHYCVVLKKEKFDLPAGRNNLFYALLVFINHIQTKHFGLLGRINLSASGLNISWVINNALNR